MDGVRTMEKCLCVCVCAFLYECVTVFIVRAQASQTLPHFPLPKKKKKGVLATS